MSNPTTAAEWKSVAAQYEQQNLELAKQVAAYDAQLVDIDKQLAEIANKIRGLARTPGGLTGREYDAMNADLVEQRRALIRQRNPIQQDKNQTNKQISENNRAIANAYSKADIAQEGEPQTETTTPPATQQPGDGATVPPATPPIQTRDASSTTIPSTNNEVIPTSTPEPSPIYNTPRDVPREETNLPPLTNEELLARAPDTGVETSAAQTSPIEPVNVITAPPEIFGMAAEPFYEVIEPQKTTDAYQDEFTGVDEAIAKQKNGEAYQDEFAGVDEAIALQEKISINTSGLPVRAEDGSVASGVAINPETGETYYPNPTGSSKGLQGARANAQAESTAQDQAAFALKKDWRVRLSLAPNSGYLYQAANVQGILQPLIKTEGVIFPYTPSIQVQYSAHYDNYDLIHSNYKIYQYKNSSVDTITISCDFTAQDTAEANYLLAVIHFFKSVTKMFYGQDSIPKIGTPPPLCFLTGLGSFQFDNHPLVITNFSYNLPTDVDYIRASASATTPAGVNKSPAQPPNNTNAISNIRLASSGGKIATGGVTPNPNFQQTTIQTPSASSRTPTYVPTKMTLAITANPIVTRNDISNRFSLRDYATGKLLQGSKNSTVGIW